MIHSKNNPQTPAIGGSKEMGTGREGRAPWSNLFSISFSFQEFGLASCPDREILDPPLPVLVFSYILLNRQKCKGNMVTCLKTRIITLPSGTNHNNNTALTAKITMLKCECEIESSFCLERKYLLAFLFTHQSILN